MIVVKYAFLEQMLVRCLYNVVGVEQELADIVFSTPRVTDLIDRITHICEIKKIKFDKNDFRDFRNKCDDIKGIRDLLAHGAWVKSPQISVLKVRGKWSHDIVKENQLDNRFKSSTPEAKVMTEQHLRAYVNGTQLMIETATKLIDALYNQIDI